MKATLGADHLRLLALIGELGSLSAAADELGLTPAAVTQRVARIEEMAGLPLVLRTSRGATLTQAGEVLAVRGARIHAETLRAREDLTEWRESGRGRLRVGAFLAAAMHVVPQALTALRHRELEADISVVDIQSHDGVRLVSEGELDVAIVAAWDDTPATSGSVRLTHIMDDPMVLVMPDDHPMANGEGPVSLASFANETWVVIRAGHTARQQFDRAAAAAGFTPRLRFETQSYDVAQALVATGYGVALVSELALVDVPGVVHRGLLGTDLHRSLYAVTPARGTAMSLANVFLALVRDVAHDDSARTPGLGRD